jgi:ATP-dependent Zn protease
VELSRSARLRSIFVYVLIVVAIVVLLFQFRSQAATTDSISLTDLAGAIQRNEVKKIIIDDNTLRITYNDGREFESRKEPISTAPDQLRALGATRLDMVMKVGIPRSLPYFFASLKIAITLSFVGTVIAEIVAGNNGIGNVMHSIFLTAGSRSSNKLATVAESRSSPSVNWVAGSRSTGAEVLASEGRGIPVRVLRSRAGGRRRMGPGV